MACKTVSTKSAVVNNVNRHPRRGVMAGITLGGGGNMRGGFACGNHVVMTAGTGPEYLAVVHTQRGRDKRRGSRGMAGFTQVGGVDMGDRFANGCHVVVTAGTGANHLVVVHGAGGHGRPLGREFLMAGIAHGGRINMPGAFTRGGHAVMAIDTVTDKAGMVYRRRQPLAGAVAAVTFLVGHHVRRVFAGGNDVVMATGTHA